MSQNSQSRNCRSDGGRIDQTTTGDWASISDLFETGSQHDRFWSDPRYKGQVTTMVPYRLVLPSVLILLSSCLGQERGGTDRTFAVPLLERILYTANTSGSLAYWGRCEPGQPYPDFPALSSPSDDSRPPLEALREVFAKDRRMEVTQDSNGLIRMFETDVPMDLLDIKIAHLSFGPPNEDQGIFNGPNDTLQTILSAPEVKAYVATHKIGPFPDAWGGSHSGPHKHQVSGDLYNVTVKQALDYILQTFPGFWIYQNCRSIGGGSDRYVQFRFYESANVVPRPDISPNKKSK